MKVRNRVVQGAISTYLLVFVYKFAIQLYILISIKYYFLDHNYKINVQNILIVKQAKMLIHLRKIQLIILIEYFLVIQFKYKKIFVLLIFIVVCFEMHIINKVIDIRLNLFSILHLNLLLIYFLSIQKINKITLETILGF